MGYQVTGLDLSQSYLDQCAASAAAAGVGVATVCSDMREIPFRDHFDAVVNLFSSFGYLESEAEDGRVLAAVAASLKPGGRFLVDLINREWVVVNQTAKDWHVGGDGTLYLEQRALDLVQGRNHVTFTVVPPQGDRREVVGHHIRLYTLTELIALLADAGLAFREAFGDFDGSAYTLASRRMIVVAERK
jgi:SAM-dependent methyltransferase